MRIKKELDIFPELTDEEKSEWLNELSQITDSKNKSA